MKDQILVDTDIVIQYLKTGKGLLPKAYEKYEMQLSTASLTELLASRTFEDSNLLEEVIEFVDKYFTVKEVSREIATKASELIRKYGVNFATATISATAICNDTPLLTEEREQYSMIEELKLHEMKD